MPSIVNVVGIQFRRAGKVYDFDGSDYGLRIGDSVVVETERGPSLAEVVRLKAMEPSDFTENKLKKILRIASGKDLETQGKLTESDAIELADEKIRKLKLDMRVLHAEIQFSGNKVIIYFSAAGRVDFRDLVKDLAAGLRARVELKQVGARDEAKLIGGMGICGREFCCSSFLRDFVPVSIKMAKNQNLALNPTKISGGCGRLLCCLTYEDETYTALRKQMPGKGTRILAEDGRFGDVIKSDFLNQSVLVELDSGQTESFKVAHIKVVEKGAGLEKEAWGDDMNLGELMATQKPEGQPRKSSQRSAPAPRPAKNQGGDKPQDKQQPDNKDSKSADEGPRRGRRGRGGNNKPRTDGNKAGADNQGQSNQGDGKGRPPKK